MTTRTKGIWTLNPQGDNIDPPILNKITEMVNQGKTDGVAEEIPGMPAPGKKTVYRDWTTAEDAQEYITWVNTLSYLPDSYIIV
jgi:hypothetical protein